MPSSTLFVKMGGFDEVSLELLCELGWQTDGQSGRRRGRTLNARGGEFRGSLRKYCTLIPWKNTYILYAPSDGSVLVSLHRQAMPTRVTTCLRITSETTYTLFGSFIQLTYS